MVEFGAKLSLKDNMYATLQKNLKMQQQFSKQVKNTAEHIKNLAKQKLAPVIAVKDKATKVLTQIKAKLVAVGKIVAKPFITIKDTTTKAITKIKAGLKAVGKTVAKPFIWLKDKLSAPLKKVGDGLKAVGKFVAKPAVWLKDKATAGLSKLKSMLGTLAKGATIAVGVAGGAIGAIAGGSISEGAKLQQSKGGIETLYKGKEGDGGVVDTVIDNANKAYMTAGISANAYMETVTSFSASLLSSLGGDTAKSASIADMAIIDMADNANKFGTDMSSIQTAYQGFAKQNYTMLDNLKLGYGGTKEEMQRLLKDAQKISGVKYDISNLADVYSAIHVVQENLGVAGATADEAKKTFTGSFNAMKASAQNVLGNLAVGGDITGSMEQLVDSATIFLVNNAIPMLGNIFTALPKAISTGIKKVAPQLKAVGGDLIISVKEGIIGMLPSSMQGVATNLFGSLGKVFGSVTDMLSSVTPKIAEKLGGVFGDGGGILDGITSAIEVAMPVVENLLLGVADTIAIVAPVLGSLGNAFMSVFPTIASVISGVLPVVNAIIKGFGAVIQAILPVAQSIFQSLGEKIGVIVGIISSKMGFFKGIFEQAMPVVTSILQTAWDIISPIIDIAISVFDTVLAVVEKVFPKVLDIIQGVWEFLKPILDGIAEGLNFVADAVGGLADWAGGAIDAVGNFFGFAYGKDRVPYDNYPAMLHAGEKVLTRNQADQYERQMSTRGVQISQISSPSSTTTSGGGATVNIEKLADTVIIEKEADVDKVVEDMVTKFKKLVPNMA